jgi:hypothetical protein
MLTIRAMVRFGPWTLTTIERVEQLEHCQRCDTKIREVWVCEVDAHHNLDGLSGQSVWRIGSDCGPALMCVSDEVWHRETKVVSQRLRAAKRLDKLLHKAEAMNYELPESVAGSRDALLEGSLEERLQKHLGLVMTHHERKLGLRKK